MNYLYPILQAAPRAHYLARDVILNDALTLPRLFIEAGKSNQVSKLYAADAGIALLRYHLRFLAHPGRKMMSLHQLEVASTHLAEVGKLLGAWINKSNTAKGG